jgi:hypothetical protein
MTALKGGVCHDRSVRETNQLNQNNSRNCAYGLGVLSDVYCCDDCNAARYHIINDTLRNHCNCRVRDCRRG